MVGLGLLADGQAVAEDGLGRGPFASTNQVIAELDHDPGGAVIGRPEPLAASLECITEEGLGLGVAAGGPFASQITPLVSNVLIVPTGMERQNHLARQVRDSWHNIE